MKLSEKIDLGLDKTRIKDPRDGLRQTATARELLARFFAPRVDDRWPLQLLADEVGMGKTFVSLAAAFSVLERMGDGAGDEPDLEGCYQKIIILAPQNSSLLKKWTREADEFVGRCILPKHRTEAAKVFHVQRCERLDEFVKAARKPGKFSERIIVAPMTLFGSVRLNDLQIKQRFILSALFRYWGGSFNRDRRERLLKGAGSDWPSQPDDLDHFEDDEREMLPCSEDEVIEEIARIGRAEKREHGESTLSRVLEQCRSVTELFQRGREEAFERLRKELTNVYRQVLFSLLNRSFPLVIVDEAHHWKNGPDAGTNGFNDFRDHIASRARRILLLTATPFQLRPREMLQLLRIGEAAEITSDTEARLRRRAHFAQHRQSVLEPTLNAVDHSSRRFARTWGQLRRSEAERAGQEWSFPAVEVLRKGLDTLSQARGLLKEAEVNELVEKGTAAADPGTRIFLRDALRLYAWNRELTAELGQVVIRHRRSVEHRLFRVGEEFTTDVPGLHLRPDRHLMHAASGIDVTGEAELPHYLLMRCVAEMQNEKHGVGRRTSLGTALTGCYSTLFESAEGRLLEDFAQTRPSAGQRYKLFKSLVGKKTDPQHPKLSAVVESVVKAWEQGEKSLVFCFRTNTAERLKDILHDRVEKVLAEQRRRSLGSEENFKRFRARLVRREDVLVGVLLDRPLWSIAAALPEAFQGVDLSLRPEDLRPLAEVLLSFGFDTDEKADHVLVGRAVEHVVTRRVRKTLRDQTAKALLDAMESQSWIERPYGADPEGLRRDGVSDEELRGADVVYQRTAEDVPASAVDRLAARFIDQRERRERRGGIAVVDLPAEGNSFWFGGSPSSTPTHLVERVRSLNGHLLKLSREDGALDWAGRRKVFQALRRVVTRDAVLIRLLPKRAELKEEDWSSLLVRNFWEHEPEGQRETMAHRVDVFLEGLTSETGSFHREESTRAASLDATRLGNDRYVALVKGGDQTGRERVFGGFNSPLFPDILVCTSVGAEGIDLHRYCRNVIHYDLAWNPAVLEQRTGRVDRIGSKTFRERALTGDVAARYLDVGIPYLAGTYDERMFEELRMRAQVFEVMTGGDVAIDDADATDEAKDGEGEGKGLRFAVLPEKMVEDLRVKLHVWKDGS